MKRHERSTIATHPNEHEIKIRGHAYALSAHPADGDAGWTARVVRYTLTGGATALVRPILDGRSQVHDQAAVVSTMRATGSTAEAALAALADRLRAAITEATRTDPGFGA